MSGSSYTDGARLRYFASCHSNLLPAGWRELVSPASGGRYRVRERRSALSVTKSNGAYDDRYNWGYFASQLVNVTRINCAVSMAASSNSIDPQFRTPINVYIRLF
ncbi:hypothetical protein BDW60DRAFT_199038 [Aspergillus nidulans var. acristatus]